MRNHTAKPERSGLVLLAVLVVVVLLSLAAYQYSDLMLAEYQAADSYKRSAKVRVLAHSGVHYTAAVLSDPEYFTENGNPFDNPTTFQGIMVQESEETNQQGRFSIVAPPAADALEAGSYRYGVVDEAGKINLNALLRVDPSGDKGVEMLTALPDMTDDIANAILDWLDDDSEPRTNGAENQYYSSLAEPYSAKNGPLDSLEELLLVRGVTPELLFGNDRNRNGLIDPSEAADGEGTLGWSAYLTFYGRELNVDSEGNPRINVNDSDLNSLNEKLQKAVGEELANYIIAYRIYGPTSSGSGNGSNGGSGQGSPGQGSKGSSSQGSNQSSGESLSGDDLDLSQEPKRSIASLFELVNSEVEIPNEDDPDEPGQRYPSPLNDSGKQRELLPKLLDKTTTKQDKELYGRININTAPEAVLMALPGLSETDAQTILNQRPQLASDSDTDAIYETAAWLITEANLSPDAVRPLENYITTRSQVYRIQSVGYLDGGGPTARIEALIDTNGGQPRIVYWRDLSELGKGFDLTNHEESEMGMSVPIR